MPTARYRKLDTGSYMVETDDGVFSGVMSQAELDRAMSEMRHVSWVPDPVGAEIAKVGWMVQEYIGSEVYAAPPGLSPEQVKDKVRWPEGFTLEPVRTPKLKVGAVLLVPSPFGGMYVGTVQGSPQGDPYFRSIGGSVMGELEWSRDDRQCWTCGGLANIKAIQRLEMYK